MQSTSNRCEGLSSGARALVRLLQPAGGVGGAADLGERPAQVWDETLRVAQQHGVAPLLHRALQINGSLAKLPDHVRASLVQERRATALDNLRKFGEFRRIAQALGERGVPVIALKGLHLAELVYRDISLRPMSDLDVLVPPSLLRKAIATVHGLGYGVDKDLADSAPAMLATKYDIELAHRRTGSLLEVHWSLDEPPDRCNRMLEEVWRSAVPARIGDADTLVMAPEFLLLHVCAHLACHHAFAFSLRALCDIGEIVRNHNSIDWAVVIDHARGCGWGRGVAAALQLASDQLGVRVPAGVLGTLGADALDADMLADAMQHLLMHVDIPNNMSELDHAVNLLAFADKRGTARTPANVWRRIFVSRTELAICYGVPRQSIRLIFYYVVRLKDLLLRYAVSAWVLNVSSPKLAAAAARHVRLAKWIAGT